MTDLLVGGIVLPLNIDYLFHHQQWHRGEILCGVWLVTDTVVCTASIWNLVAIAVDRMLVGTRMYYAR